MKNIKLNKKLTGEINTMEFNNYFKNKIETRYENFLMIFFKFVADHSAAINSLKKNFSDIFLYLKMKI